MPRAIAADQVSYADLYARWEQGNWRATEIDFSLDREQWERTFTDLERRSALWTELRATCRPHGQVFVGGELWEAECAVGADVGTTVRILRVDGLTLVVEPTP